MSAVEPEKGYAPGMTAALKALHHARRGKPSPADAPPPSTFPMTPAAREAKRLAREADRDRGRF